MVTPVPTTPALVVGKVHHARHEPIEHRFTNRHHAWLLDLDDVPVDGVLGPGQRLRPQDHLSSPATIAALRDEVVQIATSASKADTASTADTIDTLDPATITRVLMLAQVAVLGHVFDPLTTCWLLDADGVTRALVLEVHNTYGGRHCYVIEPDQRRVARKALVAKEFYVSPFNGVEGDYVVSARLTPGQVTVSVRLARGGRTVLTTWVTGVPQPATRSRILRTTITSPLMPQRISTLIRLHGVWLWARRLPVRPRPRGGSGNLR
ncbi:DUF1365 domain-containing protein [Arsenicicoccus piscis]|uniref:DUF1365 domain-containing protein n=1 Tax=Arsenicicoccus piscis TaxID=673954 RepID=UPI0024E05667|nr:DUF1365 domain-containing protein [Arsenicicoccus piscis]